MKRPTDISQVYAKAPNRLRRSFLRGVSALSATTFALRLRPHPSRTGATTALVPPDAEKHLRSGSAHRRLAADYRGTPGADRPEHGPNSLHRKIVELEYYALAGWTDRAPAMIQTLVVELLRKLVQNPGGWTRIPGPAIGFCLEAGTAGVSGRI